MVRETQRLFSDDATMTEWLQQHVEAILRCIRHKRLCVGSYVNLTNGETVVYRVSREESVIFDDGPEYVDLGLPSGTLWATFNVGATCPEEYGDYFAWGETRPKSSFTYLTIFFPSRM